MASCSTQPLPLFSRIILRHSRCISLRNFRPIIRTPGDQDEQPPEDILRTPHIGSCRRKQDSHAKPITTSDSSHKASNPTLPCQGGRTAMAAAIGPESHSTKLPKKDIPRFSIDREAIRHARGKNAINVLLRKQFEQCHESKDILTLVAVAMQREATMKQLPLQYQSIIRACFRARAYDSDKRVQSVLRIVVSRLQQEGLPIHDQLFHVGLKFAARIRSLSIMKRWLWEFRISDRTMSWRLFRSVIAKCTIGSNGYGEIRNGRWNRKDIMTILLGFSNTPSGSPTGSDPDHHLGSFLVRNDWSYFHGWTKILARCRATKELLEEWEYWKNSDARKMGESLVSQINRVKYTRERGDSHFIVHMLVAGDVQAAWKILLESGLDIRDLPAKARSRLFDDVDAATVAWNARHFKEKMRQLQTRTTHIEDEMQQVLRNLLLEKFDLDLKDIEEKLGIRWVSDGNGGGYHVVNEDLEQRWERLSSPDFFKIHGYITDTPEHLETSVLPNLL